MSATIARQISTAAQPSRLGGRVAAFGRIRGRASTIGAALLERRALPLRAGPQDGGEDPVDERRGLGAAEALGRLDGLVDRALGRDRVLARHRVGIQQLGQPDAQDRALERGDPLERPALGVLADQLVELGLVLADDARRAPA